MQIAEECRNTGNCGLFFMRHFMKQMCQSSLWIEPLAIEEYKKRQPGKFPDCRKFF